MFELMREGKKGNAPRAAAKANPAGPPPTITTSLSLEFAELKNRRNTLCRDPKRANDVRDAKTTMIL